MPFYGVLDNILFDIWLTKPSSEGVYSNETLPSFILQKILRKIKEKIKNDKIRVN